MLIRENSNPITFTSAGKKIQVDNLSDEELWQSGYLDHTTAKGMFHVVFYYNCVEFEVGDMHLISYHPAPSHKQKLCNRTYLKIRLSLTLQVLQNTTLKGIQISTTLQTIEIITYIVFFELQTIEVLQYSKKILKTKGVAFNPLNYEEVTSLITNI